MEFLFTIHHQSFCCKFIASSFPSMLVFRISSSDWLLMGIPELQLNKQSSVTWTLNGLIYSSSKTLITSATGFSLIKIWDRRRALYFSDKVYIPVISFNALTFLAWSALFRHHFVTASGLVAKLLIPPLNKKNTAVSKFYYANFDMIYNGGC